MLTGISMSHCCRFNMSSHQLYNGICPLWVVNSNRKCRPKVVSPKEKIYVKKDTIEQSKRAIFCGFLWGGVTPNTAHAHYDFNF